MAPNIWQCHSVAVLVLGIASRALNSRFTVTQPQPAYTLPDGSDVEPFLIAEYHELFVIECHGPGCRCIGDLS